MKFVKLYQIMTTITLKTNWATSCFRSFSSLQIAEESKLFCFEDVVESICTKMIKRHPHVFGNAKIESVDEQLTSWEDIKAKEREVNQRTRQIV